MSQRELTPFFAKELFPLYIEGQLDSSRRTAIERFLTEDQDTKTQYDKMKSQVEFLEQLAQLSPKPELMKFIETHQSGIKDYTQKIKWRNLSVTSRWIVQLMGVAVALVIVVYFFPWLNLARSIKDIKKTAPQLQSVEFQEEEPKRTFIGPIWPKELPSPEAYALKMQEEKNKNAAIADLVAKADEDNTAQPTDENDDEQAPQEGFLWRGTLKVEHMDQDNIEKITQNILMLGGQKAGQVELGWQKGDSSYFHFTMPIAGYTAFQEKMAEFGKLTLEKEKTSRVMKEGTMRIIMSVEAQK